MVTTGTIELYKDCKFDIYRNMSNFASLTAQNNYYAGLTKITKTITFNKIGDPIILEDDITDLIEYDYGRLSYLGKWWYFQVSDLAVNAQGRTVLSYTVDVWETMRYQYDLKLGAGTILRSAMLRKPYYRGNEWTTRPWVRESINANQSSLKPTVYAMFYSNTENMAYYVAQVLNPDDNKRINTMQVVKYMVEDVGRSSFEPLKNSTVLGAWYSSICCVDTTYWTDTNPENGTRTYYLDPNKSWTSRLVTVQADVIGDELASGIDQHFCVCDERGNVIFRFAEYVPCNKGFSAYLCMTGSSANWICRNAIHDSDGSTIGYNLFMIPLEPVDIQNDSWATYQAQQRAVDIESRNLQMQSNLVSGLANTGTNALNGALMGTAMAPGIGTAIGAIGGAITGVVSSITNYATESYYAPKEQALTDKLYKNMADNVNLLGSGVDSPFNDVETSGFCAIWQHETPVDDDVTFMNSMIDIFGYPMNMPVSSVDSYIQDGPMMAECEVLNCPTTYGAQVQDRLRQGVYFDS